MAGCDRTFSSGCDTSRLQGAPDTAESRCVEKGARRVKLELKFDAMSALFYGSLGETLYIF